MGFIRLNLWGADDEKTSISTLVRAIMIERIAAPPESVREDYPGARAMLSMGGGTFLLASESPEEIMEKIAAVERAESGAR